jgi:hypothetical protein
VVPTGSGGKVGCADKLTVAPVPVPLKVTVCGLLPALSVNERLPETVPTPVGVKVTATMHDPDAATGFEVEQVIPELAIAKGPVMAIAVKLRLELPVLVTVIVCAGLLVPTGSEGKVGGADKLTAAPVPVPVRLTLCGLVKALSVIVKVALRAPIALGVKVTLIAQVVPAAKLEPQVFVSWKSPEFVPVTPMLEMARLRLPGFESVADCAMLIIPTCSAVNVSPPGEALADANGENTSSFSLARIAHAVAARPTLSAIHWKGVLRHCWIGGNVSPPSIVLATRPSASPKGAEFCACAI